MTVRRVAQLAILVIALTACGAERSAAGSDGAAVAACRGALAEITPPERLATTVREDGGGFVVSAWRGGRADGEPDHLCQVARDEDVERGVSVVRIQTRDGSGAYRSQLDLDVDDGS